MRVLLDTSAFLFFITDSEKLSVEARNILANMENELVLSIAGLWEIAIKASLGRLELLRPFEKLIPEQLKENEISILPIELNHLAILTKLPFHHRDPFDRLIIAQSIAEGYPIITCDSSFSGYPIEVIW